MVNFDEIIADLKANRLEFDCGSMSLVQSKDDGISFEGKGYIRQSEEGVLNFKIYASKVINTDQHRFMQELMRESPRKLYSEDDFYELSAIVQNGTQWTAKNIVPHCHWSIDGSVIVTGNLNSLLTQETIKKSAEHLRVHFFEDLEIPLTLMTKTESEGLQHYQRDRAKFHALGCEFEVRKRAGELVIEARSNQHFPDLLYMRIQEALLYLTAKPVVWRVRAEQRQTSASFEITSAMPKSPNTKLGPPIRSGSPCFFEDGWRLFALYLDYAVRSTFGAYWNHCTYHLHNACESSANSIDAWAVGVSVAVEGIAGLLETDLNQTGSEKLAVFQETLRNFVASCEEFSEFAPRMNGLINMLGNDRVKDKLARLTKSGHADQRYIVSWTKLRNRQVHPKVVDLRKMATGDVQKLLDLVQQVEVLMWQLTFFLIGYSGKFSDLGKDGFVSRDYPLGAP